VLGGGKGEASMSWQPRELVIEKKTKRRKMGEEEKAATNQTNLSTRTAE